jgi:hypothetical protein
LSVALLVLFASRLVEPWNGVVQRLMVTVPMVSSAALAQRLWQRVGELDAADDRAESADLEPSAS